VLCLGRIDAHLCARLSAGEFSLNPRKLIAQSLAQAKHTFGNFKKSFRRSPLGIGSRTM
jgi:hypothetical protein